MCSAKQPELLCFSIYQSKQNLTESMLIIQNLLQDQFFNGQDVLKITKNVGQVVLIFWQELVIYVEQDNTKLLEGRHCKVKGSIGHENTCICSNGTSNVKDSLK